MKKTLLVLGMAVTSFALFSQVEKANSQLSGNGTYDSNGDCITDGYVYSFQNFGEAGEGATNNGLDDASLSNFAGNSNFTLSYDNDAKAAKITTTESVVSKYGSAAFRFFSGEGQALNGKTSLSGKEVKPLGVDLSAITTPQITIKAKSSEDAHLILFAASYVIQDFDDDDILDTALVYGDKTGTGANDWADVTKVVEASEEMKEYSINIGTYGIAYYKSSVTGLDASSTEPVALDFSKVGVVSIGFRKDDYTGTTIAGVLDIEYMYVGNAGAVSAMPEEECIIAPKDMQTISFDPLDDVSIDSENFQLTATATSNLDVTYTSSNEAVATVTESGAVTIVGIDGTTVITASQIGDQTYEAAESVTQTLKVNDGTKTTQTITFDEIDPVEIIAEDFDLVATSDSDLDVTFSSSDETVATVTSDGTVSVVGAGETNITASQAGNDTYNAADDVVQVLTVTFVASISSSDEVLVKAFPNPTSSFVQLESAEVISSIVVSDFSGNVVSKFEGTKQIDLNGVATGMYLVKVQFANGTTTNLTVSKI
jgi:hypothetical protein